MYMYSINKMFSSPVTIFKRRFRYSLAILCIKQYPCDINAEVLQVETFEWIINKSAIYYKFYSANVI